MSLVHRSGTTSAADAAVLILGLSAPLGVTAEELAQAPVTSPSENGTGSTFAAPHGLRASELLHSRSFLGSLQAVAAKAWDETSGYGAVEAVRAATGHEDGVSGYGAVEASRGPGNTHR